MPGLQANSSVGGEQETTDGNSMFLFLSFSLPSPLSKKKIIIIIKSLKKKNFFAKQEKLKPFQVVSFHYTEQNVLGCGGREGGGTRPYTPMTYTRVYLGMRGEIGEWQMTQMNDRGQTQGKRGKLENKSNADDMQW